MHYCILSINISLYSAAGVSLLGGMAATRQTFDVWHEVDCSNYERWAYFKGIARAASSLLAHAL